MAKKKKVQEFVVFADDDTFEGLNHKSNAVLVTGNFDCGNDKSIRTLIRRAREQPGYDTTGVNVQTEDCLGSVHVRIFSIAMLLEHYLLVESKS